MKIGTWNVNGIRKRQDEVIAWIRDEQPDVVCLQEIKALPEQVPDGLLAMFDYHAIWHGHKGYSGVALLLRRATFETAPRYEHPPFDIETRIVTATAGAHVFASVYVPNGGKDFAAKMKFLHAMEDWAAILRAEKKSLILCGDLNVALTDSDVHPKERGRVVGQLPEERARIEGMLGHGLVDLLRAKHPDDDGLFTWWAPWRNMKEKNIGWRLDYIVVPQELEPRAVSCDVRRSVGTSDHAPVVATLAD